MARQSEREIALEQIVKRISNKSLALSRGNHSGDAHDLHVLIDNELALIPESGESNVQLVTTHSAWFNSPSTPGHLEWQEETSFVKIFSGRIGWSSVAVDQLEGLQAVCGALIDLIEEKYPQLLHPETPSADEGPLEAEDE